MSRGLQGRPETRKPARGGLLVELGGTQSFELSEKAIDFNRFISS